MDNTGTKAPSAKAVMQPRPDHSSHAGVRVRSDRFGDFLSVKDAALALQRKGELSLGHLKPIEANIHRCLCGSIRTYWDSRWVYVDKADAHVSVSRSCMLCSHDEQPLTL